MKNATVFLFTEEFYISTRDLDSKLGGKWRPIGKTEREHFGVVDCQVGSGEPTLVVGVGHMLAIQRQERVLPGWAVNDELNERVAEWEQATGQKVSPAAKRDMKDELTIDMLPKAFIRKTVFHAWLGKDRLIIDSKSASVCDSITSLLREALGSLPCIGLQPRSIPGAVMAGWLHHSIAILPHPFSLSGETNMRASEGETGKIKIKDAELNGESIDDALACCPMVSDMSLMHKDDISFTLNENLQLGKIKLSDTLQEQVSDDSEGDKAEEQRATWLLEVAAINSALDDIFAAMGGLEGVGE